MGLVGGGFDVRETEAALRGDHFERRATVADEVGMRAFLDCFDSLALGEAPLDALGRGAAKAVDPVVHFESIGFADPLNSKAMGERAGAAAHPLEP